MMRLTSSVILPSHIHTETHNTYISVPKAQITVCNTAYFPEMSRRVLVLPILGLAWSIVVIYRRFTVMRTAYAHLHYTPNKHCEDKLCSRLHPQYYKSLIIFGILGGIGVLIPLLILGITIYLIKKMLYFYVTS
ncbi:putative inner membrane protein [Chlamydia abortus]|uniref:Inner membrane protein n=2 Tax=Chlamydia abortus TaxID=83555 RepID=Q5L6E6_CHLAB|nr:hypothetical protein [Chlamydia abortus]ASD30503.1 hypothetical protein CEF07_01760 [Chlamydia abortus]CAH63780.1 putative inner membrane protein [Chlamydia abortus S26/3]CED80385.1 putative inner membrane protein [Chlamydia abortus]CED81345.1 putative inner membrane protein [Chlamydia abortus]CEF16791.1 putative inner membrane protein [Chlamydia abortus]